MMNSPTLTVSPTKLQPPYIKRHGHKRSSAISGDFDINNGMSIFLNSPTQLSKSVPINNSPIKQKLFGDELTLQQQQLENTEKKTPPLQQQQQLPMINIENSSISSSSFNYDSPLKSSPHTVNSPNNIHNNKISSSATRFFMTNETKFEKYSEIPNALIDLDDIITKPQVLIKHKRTESAPAEFTGFANTGFERFLTSPVRNEVVVEEDEESDDNESISSHLLSKVKNANIKKINSLNSESSSISSLLSNNLISLALKNPSSNSLHSLPQQQQPEKAPSTSSLRGKAARYQNYYNTQQKVGSVKPVSNKNFENIKPISRSSSKSPTRKPSPSSLSAGFKFESVVYDMPENLLSDYHYNYNDKPKMNAAASPPLRSSSPLKNELTNHKHERSRSLQSSPEKPQLKQSSKKTHKKSNSLFNSFNKIHHFRRNSSSSMASRGHRKSSSSIISKTTNEELIYYANSSTNNSIHDQTLTSTATLQKSTNNFSFDLTLNNLGEPGPMIFNPEPETNNFNSILNDNEHNDNNDNGKDVKKIRHRWWFRKNKSPQ